MTHHTSVERFFQARPYLAYVFLFLIAVSLFVYLHSDLTFPDPDSFYHAKMALVLRDQGAISAFPWLTATELPYRYVDHHFLYHLLLIPFVTIFNPLLGLKIATILFAALAIVALYWFLRQLQIPGALWYALFVLTLNPFLFRLNLAKAQAVVLIFLFVALYLLFQRKYLPLLFVSFLYVWLYAGWPVLIVLTAVYTAVMIVHAFFTRTTVIKPRRKKVFFQSVGLLFSVVVGLLAGVFFNPYFPKNLLFYWRQIVEIAVVNYQHVIGVGGEWYPYPVGELVLQALPLTVLVAVATVVFIVTYRRQSAQAWFFGLASFMFLALTLKSRRNVEYLAPFAVTFCALSLRVFWPPVVAFFARQKIRVLLVLILVALVAPFAVNDWSQLKSDYRKGFAFDHFLAPAAWLAVNTPDNSIVFHSDWDEFPFLFYYNTHNRYIVGLDPTFMYRFDQSLHKKWVDVVRGATTDAMYSVIKDVFGAEYVLVDYRSNSEFDRNLASNFNFELTFEDDSVKIYRVIQ